MSILGRVVQGFAQAVWPPWIERATQKAMAGGLGSIGTSYAPSGGAVDIGSGVRVQGWQTRAWYLWDCVGELQEPTSNIARLVSRQVGFRETSPDRTTQDTERDLQTALGAMDLGTFVNLVVLNFQVTGEVWIFRTELGWEACSVTDPNLKDRIERAKSAGKEYKRFWNPHPADPSLAVSAFKGALDPAEDLATLSALSRAQSRSRIAQAGILMVPSEQRFEGGDPFGTTLEKAMTTAIQDVTHPSALSPVKVEMAGDLIEKVRHLTFDRPYDDNVPVKIEQATRRIALALDMPPEMLLGMGQMSHWNAWIVQEDTWKSAIAPLAERAAEILEWISAVMGRVISLEPDPTELLIRRSSTRDAIEAAQIGAVGLAYVRTIIGANETDAPTPQDLETIRSLGGRRSSDRTDSTGSAPGDGSPPESVAAGAGRRGPGGPVLVHSKGARRGG
jgi:hypothetical protein